MNQGGNCSAAKIATDALLKSNNLKNLSSLQKPRSETFSLKMPIMAVLLLNSIGAKNSTIDRMHDPRSGFKNWIQGWPLGCSEPPLREKDACRWSGSVLACFSE
ncbi:MULTISPECIES: hypothetical protein [unclassified Phyllobacterium]|uniref:hypothetical protein n=1 Tax=unclassified Phyllobacterium TaxID=2638441 RepID=UPI00111339D5|nr:MULTISPECIES: hypothetical protein [unclassified Phyllobacterium]